MITQAVILAGGRGKRLGSLTKQTPKPMLPVAGKPFLEYVIERLKAHAIRNVLLSVGYQADRIVDYFGDGRRVSMAITYAIESQPAGTGGALALARDQLHSTFLVLNGDTLFDIDYSRLIEFFQGEKARAAIALREINDAGRYGTVTLQKHNITGFFEKGKSGPGIVNGGVYVLRKDCIDEIETIPSSLEENLFPRLAAKDVLVGKTYEGFFIDIGVPEMYRQAEKMIEKWKHY